MHAPRVSDEVGAAGRPVEDGPVISSNGAEADRVLTLVQTSSIEAVRNPFPLAFLRTASARGKWKWFSPQVVI